MKMMEHSATINGKLININDTNLTSNVEYMDIYKGSSVKDA